jgi:S-formylglutathione hydrolase FrmB
MPVHPFDPPRGRVETLAIDSRALVGNLLGDPVRRSVAVYLPPGYDEARTEYPLFVVLASFTGSGLGLVGWRAFGESLPQRVDRLVAAGAMGPVVLALPDCFTSLGGNQYIDSIAVGNWATFLVDEMLPALGERFRVRREATGRALLGRSSGGYGALVHGMRRRGAWGAVACHSGDMAFDLVYRPDLPKACDVLARHGGSVRTFVEHVRAAQRVATDETTALMMLALAATYDPDPRAPLGVRLPVDPHTCEIIDERWAAWLRHDPLRLVEERECQENLRRLGGLFIDCGTRDPYALHYGARALVRRLSALGIPHVHEEFDDVHSGIDYRMDRSLPWLYDALGSTS